MGTGTPTTSGWPQVALPGLASQRGGSGPLLVTLSPGHVALTAVPQWTLLILDLLPSFLFPAQSPTVADPLQQAYAGMQHYAGVNIALAPCPPFLLPPPGPFPFWASVPCDAKWERGVWQRQPALLVWHLLP